MGIGIELRHILAYPMPIFVNMNIEIVLLSIAILLLGILLWKSFQIPADKSSQLWDSLDRKSDQLLQQSQRQEQLLKEDFRITREDQRKAAVEQREEVLRLLTELTRGQQEQLQRLEESQRTQIGELIKSLEEKLLHSRTEQERQAKDNREEQSRSLKEFRETFGLQVKEFGEALQKNFGELLLKQNELIKTTELRLEKMRETVDEKLQKTLETRLGQSFEIVTKQLLEVQKGLGEMQSLAGEVGGLKRVLSNVKTRGILGEIQLGALLEQILAPEQYSRNVKTRPNSNDIVEYAIKLPGKADDGTQVWLPIDAKFPQEAFERLQIAYDHADPIAVDESVKALEQFILRSAKDIHDKYVEPPHTTDFAILFLPVEGLYAEIVRRHDLLDKLQREYQVIVTGPTTLAAILNSLLMGFRTLAIQKRSSEVWQVLGAVKTEFKKFGGVLQKAQKKITEANSELDSLVGTRTRMIESKLRTVQALTETDSIHLLEEGTGDSIADIIPTEE